MTRKDFELIAQAVKRTRDQLDCDPSAVDALDIVAEHLASALAGANNRFDRPRFLDACGVPGLENQ